MIPGFGVWMNGELAGRWYRGRTGHHRFVYEEPWLASSRTRPISLSMPVSADRTVEGITVAHFFDNLLPDSGAITHPDMNSATAFLMNPG